MKVYFKPPDENLLCLNGDFITAEDVINFMNLSGQNNILQEVGVINNHLLLPETFYKTKLKPGDVLVPYLYEKVLKRSVRYLDQFSQLFRVSSIATKYMRDRYKLFLKNKHSYGIDIIFESFRKFMSYPINCDASRKYKTFINNLKKWCGFIHRAEKPYEKHLSLRIYNSSFLDDATAALEIITVPYYSTTKVLLPRVNLFVKSNISDKELFKYKRPLTKRETLILFEPAIKKDNILDFIFALFSNTQNTISSLLD